MPRQVLEAAPGLREARLDAFGIGNLTPLQDPPAVHGRPRQDGQPPAVRQRQLAPFGTAGRQMVPCRRQTVRFAATGEALQHRRSRIGEQGARGQSPVQAGQESAEGSVAEQHPVASIQHQNAIVDAVEHH